MSLSRTRHRDGCYRYAAAGKAWFGQIMRDDTLRRPSWHAEIRNSESGAVIRYGGKWARLRDAEDEIEFLLSRSPSERDDGNEHDVDDPMN